MRVIVSCIVLAISGASLPALSQAAVTHYDLDIPREPLDEALKEFARQTGLQVARFSEVTRDSGAAGPVVGSYTTEEALSSLLADTDLSYRLLTARTIAIVPKHDASSASSRRDTAHDGAGQPSADSLTDTDQKASRSFWDRFRLAQVDQGTTPRPLGSARADSVVDTAGAPASSAPRLEEVVVTATKRNERAQDIPISIAVIGNEDIERRGLIGMEDYLRSVPGVSQVDNGPQSNAVIIRGITTSATFENIGAGPTVGTYFDETPVTGAGGLGQGGIDIRPVDLERIEVLRGPQGTTYGSSSLGGTLRLIPAKPSLEAFGGKVVASYSDTGRYGGDNSMAQGVINVPVVTDTFALRAVGYRYDQSGVYRNVAGTDPATLSNAASVGLTDFVRGYVQNDVGRIVTEGGRISALWKATDNVTVSLGYLKQQIEGDGSPIAGVGAYEQAVMPIAPLGRVRGQNGEVADTDLDLLSAVVDLDLGWGAITSVLSRVDAKSAFATDLSRIFLLPISQTGRGHFKSTTAEARLASKLEGPFQYLAGVYYESIDNDYFQTIDYPGPPETNPFLTYPTLLNETARPLDQKAVFGELTYAVTSTLKATLGARYFDFEKRDDTLFEGGLLGRNPDGSPAVPIGGGAVTQTRTKQNDTNFKANLSYKPSDDALLYATWSQGFRLGRPDIGALPGTCDLNGDGIVDGTTVSVASTRNIKSDFLDNYELGGKLSLLEQRMTLDAAVYHINWKDLPIRFFPSAACGYTANAGAAESEGVELQTGIAVTQGLRVNLGGGYTRAKLTEDAPDLNAKRGDRLPGSPRVNANLGAQYAFALAGHQAFVRADSFYYGKFYSSFGEVAGLDAGNYVKVDARAGVLFDRVSVELFGQNLTNRDARTWAESFRVSQLRPRTVGVQLSYSFQ